MPFARPQRVLQHENAPIRSNRIGAFGLLLIQLRLLLGQVAILLRIDRAIRFFDRAASTLNLDAYSLVIKSKMYNCETTVEKAPALI